jgi:16S rRNA (cytidine1402-2'-O)-methyltransferase
MGSLVLVATPIGNLGDLSPRSIDALAGAALICCEDTRRTAKLLHHAGITGRRLAVVNEHTEGERVGDVVHVLDGGGTVVLVSDAGTPAISDPGAHLVRSVIDRGHTVSAVPGPAALVMALVLSGLPTSRFVFEGFLPRSGGDRTTRLAEVAAERRTTVLYEAPHRLRRTLDDLAAVCGDARPIAIARELTKLHEEVWRGTLGEAVPRARSSEPIGEHVLVLGGAGDAPPAGDDEIEARLRLAVEAGASVKSAVTAVATQLGVGRNRVYAVAVSRVSNARHGATPA